MEVTPILHDTCGLEHSVVENQQAYSSEQSVKLSEDPHNSHPNEAAQLHEPKPSSSSRRKNGSGRATTSTPEREMPASVLKVLVTNNVAGGLIGKGGEMINEMQAQSGACIRLSQTNDFFPGTRERTVLLSGEAEAVMHAQGLVLRRVSLDPWSRSAGGAPPGSSPADVDLLLARVVVPSLCAGSIIGRQGANINALKLQTGANIKLVSKADSLVPHERLVNIQGGLTACVAVVNAIIERLGEEDPDHTRYQNMTTSYSRLVAASSSLPSRDVLPPPPPLPLPLPPPAAAAATTITRGEATLFHQTYSSDSEASTHFPPATDDDVNTSTGQEDSPLYAQSSGGGGGEGLLPPGDAGRGGKRGPHSTDAATLSPAPGFAPFLPATPPYNSHHFHSPSPLSHIDHYQYRPYTDAYPPPPPVSSSSSAPHHHHHHHQQQQQHGFGCSGAELGSERGGGGMHMRREEHFVAGGVASGWRYGARHHHKHMSGAVSPLVVQLAVPDSFVPCILGVKGAALRDLKHLSQAHIRVSGRGEFVPGTSNRIVTLTGTLQATSLAQFLISQRVQIAQGRAHEAALLQHLRAQQEHHQHQHQHELPPPQPPMQSPTESTALSEQKEMQTQQHQQHQHQHHQQQYEPAQRPIRADGEEEAVRLRLEQVGLGHNCTP